MCLFSKRLQVAVVAAVLSVAVARAEFVQTTGSLGRSRFDHNAVLLRDGKVLVLGGGALKSGAFSSAELYDPFTGTFSFSGSMQAARRGAMVAPLPNGMILVCGGDGANTAETYNPATASFSGTASTMRASRSQGTATLLRSGKVLITGTVQKAELFDYTTGQFTDAADMLSPRTGHTASLLPSGKVLIAGGTNGGALATAEIYDPADGSFHQTGSMNTARVFATSTVLPDGKVLIAGGNGTSTVQNSAELYDPEQGTFSTLGSVMTSPRSHHTATLLPSGLLLLAGGSAGSSLNTTDVYDPATRAFTAGPVMATARASAAATTLLTGEAIVIGGSNGVNALASAEVYRPGTGFFTIDVSPYTSLGTYTATLLPNGKVLALGSDNVLSFAYLYDPFAHTYEPTGKPSNVKSDYTTTLLTDGTVLVVGGRIKGDYPTTTAEIYDPASGTFHSTGSLNHARFGHTATLMPDGRVMIYGGQYFDLLFNAVDAPGVEIYNPPTGTFSIVGANGPDPVPGRHGHTATLLADGNVLIAGGSTSSFAWDLFDGMTLIAPASTLPARIGNSATLLPNGKVLVAGGGVTTAELYDPLTRTYGLAGLSANAQSEATLLPGGKVLYMPTVGYPATTELYDTATSTFVPDSTVYEEGLLLRVLLQSGDVFYGDIALSAAYFYHPGVTARAPAIATIPAVIHQPAAITVTGTGFRGDSESSSGSYDSSPSDAPTLQLQRIDNDQVVTLPAETWSDVAFTSLTIGGLPYGFYRAMMFVNGVPSAQKIVSVVGPTPIVTGISSNSGPVDGGQSITMTGSYLRGAAVSFDGAAATMFSNDSDSTITLVTPPHAQGIVDVVVKTVSGELVIPGAYRYSMPAPVSTSAVAVSSTSVNVSWPPVPGATGYEIQRSSNGLDFQMVAATSGPALTDVLLSPDSAYLYRVRATRDGAAGEYGPADLATTVIFTDDPLVPGSTPVRAAHLQELRSGVAAVYKLAFGTAISYSDAIGPGSVIKSSSLLDLIALLNPARSALGLPQQTYSNPATGGPIRAVHFGDIRDALR